MEDDQKIKMEDDQNNSKCKTAIQFKMEDDQNRFKMEDKKNQNGRRLKKSKWKTTKKN